MKFDYVGIMFCYTSMQMSRYIGILYTDMKAIPVLKIKCGFIEWKKNHIHVLMCKLIYKKV